MPSPVLPIPPESDDRPSTGVQPAVLGYDEAATYIGMKRSWLEHSDVPRVRLGRRVLFLIADLDTYLAQRRDRDAA